MKTRILIGWAAVGVAVLALASTAGAEDVPLVDGKMWSKTAPVLKRAYLVEISNLMSVEYMYQKKFGPPQDSQTTIQRLYEEIDDVTLSGAVDRIDKWYDDHADQLDMTVLEVIWLDMVASNLPASRKYEQDEPDSEGNR